MLMPKVFRRENLFDDWFDGFDLMDREMEQLNRKLTASVPTEKC